MGEQNGGMVDQLTNDRHAFENDWLARSDWLMDVPMDEREGVTFDDVLGWMREHMPHYEEAARNSMMGAKCVDKRVPGEPLNYDELMKEVWGDDMDMDMDWEKMKKMMEMFEDLDVEMDDGYMKVEGDGLLIEMEEGEDGYGSMRIVLESATKLAASAASLAAAMTLF